MKSRIAILIDAENVAARHWPAITSHAATLGSVNVCQIFGDFSDERLGKWLDVAREHGLQPMLQLSGGKNSSDIAMTVAAMDILHAGRVEAIGIVSSDQDFAPLIRRLRAAGLRVFGFGLSNTPESLRIACTDFTVLGSAAKPAKLAAVAAE